MRRLVFFLCIVFFVQCSSPKEHLNSLPDGVQAISLLGDTLNTSSSTLPPALTNRIDSLITLSKANDNATDALIWEARLLGYNGEYRQAVGLLTKGLEADPENPALYRHRGHRYISLREFDLAIKDLQKAAELIKGTDDVIEQDGLPNALNKPTSTLHTNIWYHLGLAYYLTQQYDNAQEAYVECINASTNHDMLVASLYWYYMSLRRDGQDEFAGTVIDPVETELDIIENDSYHKLLLVFKGEFNPDMILDAETDALSNATIGYGIGNWHYINGRTERALEIWQDVYNDGNWASFGFIASEAELAQD